MKAMATHLAESGRGERKSLAGAESRLRSAGRGLAPCQSKYSLRRVDSRPNSTPCADIYENDRFAALSRPSTF